MKKLMLMLFAAATSVAFAGDAFYWWQTPQKTSGYTQATFDYGDPANWSLSPDEYVNPDDRIPGEDDTICTDKHPDLGHPYYYYYGGFDLGGETRTIGGYSATQGAYHCTRIDLTNGTFVVKNPSRVNNQARAYYVMDKATLVYPETSVECAVAGGALLEMWDIAAGGRGEMYAKVAVCGTSWDYVAYLVHEGGTMVFAPKGLNTTSSNYGTYGVVFENQGTMLIPDGINWDGASWNNESVVEKDRMRFRQTSGRMLLGGDVRKTGRNHTLPGELTFELAGGTLEVSNSVTFYTSEDAKIQYDDPHANWGDQVFAEMPANASATVDVQADSSIDMSPFTYGANAMLVKDGPGKMMLGANRPSSLTVKAGVLAFKGALTDLSDIVFEDGAILEFPQPNTELKAIDNAANMVFTVGEGFVAGDTVLLTDATLAETVAANMVMPDYLSECEARAVGGAVVLYTVPKVTIAVRDFVQVKGSEAKNGGVAVTGLQRGDTLENAFSGTLAYSYGDYTVESPAGTYEVSVSGLTSEKYQITYVPGTMTVVDASTPAVFYWKGGNQYLDFADLSNWAFSQDLETPATRLPCERDSLWIKCEAIDGVYYDGCFDLGGGSYSFAKLYGAGSEDWKQGYIGLTNGVLTILNPSWEAMGLNHAPRYEIFDDATLVYPYATAQTYLSPSGLQERWVIHSGGRGELYNYHLFCGTTADLPAIDVQEGGTFIFDPYGFGTSAVNYGMHGVQFVNNGTMILPHGINWCNESSSADSTGMIGTPKDRIRFRQMGGTMVLGGDVCKTKRNVTFIGELVFELAGGTLQVENDVRFYTADAAKDAAKGWDEQVFAEMPEGAAATVDVKAGGSIDMTPFTFGAGASLVKQGAGRMTLGAVRPASLNVKAGEICFATTLTDLTGVTLADGATVVFGASGNALDSLANADRLNFTVRTDFPLGHPILASSDPVLLQTVLGRMSVPEGLDGTPVIVNGRIMLRSNVPLVVMPHPRTIVVGEDACGNGYTVSGPAGAAETITGEPVYDFGGYVSGGSAGTYELGISGLSSDGYDITYEKSVLTVIGDGEGRTFYWKGEQAFAAAWDTNNWSFASDFSGAVTRLPCSADKIWCKSYDGGAYWYNGCYDFGGGSCTILTFDGSQAGAWRQCLIGLTNGVFSVLKPNHMTIGIAQSPRYEIFDGATLVYPADAAWTSFSPSGLFEQWVIHSGGRGEIFNSHEFGSASEKPVCEIEEGGSLLFDPSGFGTSPNNFGAEGVLVVNRGALIAPHGIDWNNESNSCDPTTPDSIDRARFRQAGGTMLLGGDVCKTARNVTFRGELVFELAGGTLQVENDVRFYTAEAAKDAAKGWDEQVFAEMPEGASATIDVMAGSSIDMTPFTYGANAALTKTGPGTITFGPVLPSALTVNGGTVAFAAPTAETEPSMIAFGPDCTGRFRLRVWKDGEGNVVNDTIDFGEGLSGDFQIKPQLHGFRLKAGETIRLGDWPAASELPAATFADRNWTFCRVDGDPDSVYLRYMPIGLSVFVR